MDTRALTRRIWELGAPNAVVAHQPDGKFDIPALVAQAKGWSGLEGLDLAKDVTCAKAYGWTETAWARQGYGTQEGAKLHVVAVDFGAKKNILRLLASSGCRVTVVPAQTSAADIYDRTGCSFPMVLRGRSGSDRCLRRADDTGHSGRQYSSV